MGCQTAGRSRRVFWLAVGLMCSSLLLSGCNVFVNLMQTKMASLTGSIQPGGEGSGMMHGGSEPTSGDSGSPGEPGSIALACPSEPKELLLTLNHTWTFTPAGQDQVMTIQGNMLAGASCFITVSGSTITAPDCHVPYSNSGTIAGQCDMQGQSDAIISFEGYCEDGQITLTITEVQNPDTELGGAMNCPNVSQPYVTFYPPSITTRTFFIDDAGSQQTEGGGDLAGFQYQKSWVLTPLN